MGGGRKKCDRMKWGVLLVGLLALLALLPSPAFGVYNGYEKIGDGFCLKADGTKYTDDLQPMNVYRIEQMANYCSYRCTYMTYDCMGFELIPDNFNAGNFKCKTITGENIKGFEEKEVYNVTKKQS